MPEKLAADLEALNNQGTSQRAIAERFMTQLRTELEANPSHRDHPDVKAQIERFERNIGSVDEAWARAQLEVLQNSRSSREAVVAHSETLTPEQYEQIAHRVVNSNVPHENDRDVFYFQLFYNEIHADSRHIDVDGLVGPQVLGVIDTHTVATQVFLNELGENLVPDGVIGDKTKAALGKYFGIDLETEVASQLAATIQEEYDRIHAMSDAELHAALAEANSRGTEKLSDKRAYISEFVRRYKEAGISIVPNTQNKYVLTDINGNAVDTTHTQEDLQIIMVMLSVDGNNIFQDEMLKENIANNIFDYVIAEKGLEKATGEAWKASDFESSNLVTEAEANANKTACVSQINEEIAKLRAENAKDTTNHSQKQANILMIQKLEIAKIFVQDRTRISRSSLEFARRLSEEREEMARALGTTEEEMVSIWGQMEAGDAGSLVKSMIFPTILAFIAGIFSRLLPEGVLRKAFQGGILGMLGLKLASEASERGYGITRPGDVAGSNQTPTTSPDALASYREALNAILTNAPSGLEARHKNVYAELVKYGNETGGALKDRRKIDTTFLILSQSPTFRSKQKSELVDIDAAKARTLVGADIANTLNAQGVTDDDIKIFLRMFVETTKGETQDITVGDMFVEGKESDESNALDVTWVAGDAFSQQNKNINTQILLLSGAGFGVAEELRNGSIRAEVEEILGEAEPGFAAWMTANILERAGMDDWNITHPSITHIDTVASKLTALSGRTKISSTDKKAIGIIKNQYDSIKKTLKNTQKVDTYLSEASAVYSIAGSVVRFGENVIDWVRGFGSPIATTGNVPATTVEIDAMITEGESLAADSKYADRKDDILRVVENLRLYRINRLDETANDTGLSSTERNTARTEADGILKSAVEANLALYTTTLESIRQETVALRENHTSTNAYIAAIAANKENIATLARLKGLGVSTNINGKTNTFTADATALYDEVFTNGIVKNFTQHVENQKTALTAINTSTSVLNTRDEIQKAEENFQKVQQELVMTGMSIDVLNFFGLVKDDYEHTIGGETGFNAVLAMDELFKKISNGATSTINFDANTLNINKAGIEARRREVIGNLEDEKITKIIAAGSPVLWSSIDVSNDDHITALISEVEKREKALEGLDRSSLDEQIKEVVAMFIAKIPVGVDQVASDALDDLKDQYDRFEEAVGNAGDDSFEEAYDEKMKEITEYSILNIRISNADESIGIILGQIATELGVKYDNEGNLKEGLLFDSKGEVKYVEYNTNGKVISGPYYDEDGKKIPNNSIDTHPFYRDIISQVGTTNGITLSKMFAEINSGLSSYPPNTQKKIQAKQGEIISVLAPEAPEISAKWIKETYGSIEEYITRFYNTVTQ